MIEGSDVGFLLQNKVAGSYIWKRKAYISVKQSTFESVRFNIPNIIYEILTGKYDQKSNSCVLGLFVGIGYRKVVHYEVMLWRAPSSYISNIIPHLYK